MQNKPFSHAEAIQEVYRYTPQIRDYDRFMHIGARWLPYTMYFHEKNFRSAVVNTDALGFRYSVLNGTGYSPTQLNDVTRVNLLMGGSTALGVGSTSDAHTVASYLSSLTGEVWLTFAGRGYNAMQEFLLYAMHQHRLPPIWRVVVFSGMNTLALEGMPDSIGSDHGKYYYSFEFEHYMNKFNEDMKLQRNSFAASVEEKSIISRVKDFFRGDNPADVIMSDHDVPLQTRIDAACEAITRSLRQLKLLLAEHAASVHFVLQPLSYWTDKVLTEAEHGVFHAIDSCPNNFYRLFSGVLGPEVHDPFFSGIRSRAHDVPCHDMNTLLPLSKHFNDTLFVDRVHFNDQGNHEVAKLIHRHVLKGY